MPRRKPFTLPLTPAEQEFVDFRKALRKRALDDFGAGDPTLLNMMRAEAVELIVRYKARRWGHRRGVKLTTEQRLRIASQQKTISASKPRDSRGRFTR